MGVMNKDMLRIHALLSLYMSGSDLTNQLPIQFSTTDD
jgi:hypothetical protein